MGEKYQCCFCGRTIQSQAPDVGGLRYTTCVDGEAHLQRDQFLFCHTQCLVERLHSSVHLYVADLVRGPILT